MDNDMLDALEAIDNMIKKSREAQAKFKEGTSQHTLQKNRIKSLEIAYSLINGELGKEDVSGELTQADLKKSVAPIKSLISKSEKAKTKLKEESWQYQMLDRNIAALKIALPLVLRGMGE